MPYAGQRLRQQGPMCLCRPRRWGSPAGAGVCEAGGGRERAGQQWRHRHARAGALAAGQPQAWPAEGAGSAARHHMYTLRAAYYLEALTVASSCKIREAVFAFQVLGPSTPEPLALVLDVPSAAFLPALLSHPTLQRCQAAGEPTRCAVGMSVNHNRGASCPLFAICLVPACAIAY